MRQIAFYFCLFFLLSSCSKNEDIDYTDVLGTWFIEYSNPETEISQIEIENYRTCKVWVIIDGASYYDGCEYYIKGNVIYIDSPIIGSRHTNQGTYYDIKITNLSASEMSCNISYKYPEEEEKVINCKMTRHL